MEPGSIEAEGSPDEGAADSNDDEPRRIGPRDEASSGDQVETESTYRRLQRFFAGFAFGYEALGSFCSDWCRRILPTWPPKAELSGTSAKRP